MLLNLLTSDLPAGGRMVEIPEALLYAIIGFIVVFAGIAFLIAVVWAVGKVLENLNGKNTAVSTPKTPVKEKPAQAMKAQDEEVDEETVAVIMATLMAYYQTNNPKCEFTVKRIKRI